MYRLIAVIALLLIQTQCLAQRAADPADYSNPAYHHYNLGVELQSKSKFKEALQEYQIALSMLMDARFYYAIGTAYQHLGDYDKAIESVEHAEAIAPNEVLYKDVWKTLSAHKLVTSAVQKHHSGDLEGAVADYKAALKLKDQQSTHINLAGALSALHRQDEARIEWQKAGFPAPTYFEGYGDFLTPDGLPIPAPVQ